MIAGDSVCSSCMYCTVQITPITAKTSTSRWLPRTGRAGELTVDQEAEYGRTDDEVGLRIVWLDMHSSCPVPQVSRGARAAGPDQLRCSE
jgi:hypothetical protein